MDDKPSPETPAKEFNSLDLSQLQDFSFGTQWSQDKVEAPGGKRPGREARERGDRRDDRPPRVGPGGDRPEPRKDRRTFRRPAGAPTAGEGLAAPRPEREHGPRPDRRGGLREGGPREGGPREGGRRFERGPRPNPIEERLPYVSPHYEVTFYPEDVSFTALAKTIRSSCRTFELFDIARTVIGKNDRFVAVVQPKSGPRDEATERGRKVHVALPAGLLFDSEEGAINHVVQHCMEAFFVTAQVEIDPPKGSYQVINKCGVTGALLGPPNYHRYNQLVQQHHAAHAAHLPLEVYRSRIQSVRDPEVVNQWLDSMKTVTRYTWKTGETAPGETAAASPAEAEAAPEVAPEPAEPATEAAPVAAPEVMTEAVPAPEAVAAPAVAGGPSFDNVEDARLHLLTQARDKVVRAVDSGRLHGNKLDLLPDGEIKRAVIGALERQRRFPLDTANALRGRLRREGFSIFKRGSKGVSFVCAVKRKFRVPGQTFAESIGELIHFIETHPQIKASELPERFLGLSLHAPEGAEQPVIAPEDQRRLAQMQGDLRWLVTEGYVTEFLDGSLFAPPVIPAPKAGGDPKKRDQADNHEDEEDAEPAAEEPAEPPSAEPTAEDAPVEAAAAEPASVEVTPEAAVPAEPAPAAPSSEEPKSSA
jgi:hypothetical protein